MVYVEDISIVTCIALVLSTLFKPNVHIRKHSYGTYWLVALTGAIILVAARLVSFSTIIDGLTAKSSVNPIKILVLFLSMTVQSIFLDEMGLFRYCANMALKKAKGSQLGLFFCLYAVVSILTVFTSNDIIILTFTPFICYFSKNAHINPIPYLFTEFVAANTWSMALIIGNPTNVYLASANGIAFLGYSATMILPTIAGGLTTLLLLYLIFRKSFKEPMSVTEDNFEIKDKKLMGIGVAHLSLCTILLVVSSYVGIEMWLVTFVFAVSLFFCAGTYLVKHKENLSVLATSAKRMPWELIPFVLSMFVFVLAFDQVGLSSLLGSLLGSTQTTFRYGFASFLAANLVNNIPMSVLFSSIVKSLPSSELMKGVFAAIVGSNLGAYFTPLGALAGIMWSGILKKQGVKFNFLTYIKYGALISIPTLIVTLLTLNLVL